MYYTHKVYCYQVRLQLSAFLLSYLLINTLDAQTGATSPQGLREQQYFSTNLTCFEIILNGVVPSPVIQLKLVCTPTRWK